MPNRKKKQSKEDVIDDAELQRDRARVPDFLLEKFGSFGFVKWTSAHCPVLIVDPMELIRRKVLPEGIYHAWMYRIDLNLEDDTEKVSALIYWYGTTYEFSVVALEDVISYENGQQLGYDKIPDFMKQRMDRDMSVPAVYQLVKDGMAELESTSFNIPPNERSSNIVNPKRKRQVVLNEWHALSMEPPSEEEEIWEEQKSKLLDRGLPNCESFGTIGFLPFKMKGDSNANGKNPSLSSSSSSSSSSISNSNFKHIHPVMILSPFRVPPGQVRKEWFNKCTSKQMVLVYWFGAYICGKPQAAYSFAYMSQITSWEDGMKLGYDKLPPHILEEYQNGPKPSRSNSTVAATTTKSGKKKGRPPKNKKGGSNNNNNNTKAQPNAMVDWLVCGHWEMKHTMEKYPTPSERWGGIEDFEETFVEDDFDYYYECIEAAEVAAQEKERATTKEEENTKQQQQQQQGGDDGNKKKGTTKKQKQQPQKEKPQKGGPKKVEAPQKEQQQEQEPQKGEQPKQEEEKKNTNVEPPRGFNEDGRPPPPRPANTQKPKRKNSIPRKTSNIEEPPKDQHPFAAAAMSYKSKLQGGSNGKKSKPNLNIARHVNGFVDKCRSRKSLTKPNKKLKIIKKKKRKKSDSSIDGYSDDSLRSGSMDGTKDLKRRSIGDLSEDRIRKKLMKERPPEIINGSNEPMNEKSSGSLDIFRIPRKGDKSQNGKEERRDDKNSNVMKMEIDEVNIKKNDDIASNTNGVKQEEQGGIFDDADEEKVSHDVASSKPTLNGVNTKIKGRESQEIGNIRISKRKSSVESKSTPPSKTAKSKESIHDGLPNELFSPKVGPRKRASLTVNARVANKSGDMSLRQHLANANYALDGGISPFKVSSVSNDDVGDCSADNSNDASLDDDVRNSLLSCAAALRGNASAKSETDNNKSPETSKKRGIDHNSGKASIII